MDGRKHAPNLFLIPLCHKIGTLELLCSNAKKPPNLNPRSSKEASQGSFEANGDHALAFKRFVVSRLCLPFLPSKHKAEATGNNWDVLSLPS